MPDRQSSWFLGLFALAYTGALISFEPFLFFLLPSKIARISGTNNVELLSLVSLFGGAVASIANIAFGWASDIVGTRRSWALGGVLCVVIAYGLVARASSIGEIVAAIVVLQLAINMLLSPLMAWAADTVPGVQKGLLGGLLAAATPITALATLLITSSQMQEEATQLLLISLLVAGAALPLLLVGRPRAVDVGTGTARTADAAQDWANLAKIWVARLLAQIATVSVDMFMIYYFKSVVGLPGTETWVARLYLLAQLAALPLGLLIGRLSNRAVRRRGFLAVTATLMAAGLSVMASGSGFWPIAVAYVCFICGSTVFFALHSVFAMENLPSPQRRGRDLGILNLTNTIPVLVAPMFGVWLIPSWGYGVFMGALAACVCVSGILLAKIRVAE